MADMPRLWEQTKIVYDERRHARQDSTSPLARQIDQADEYISNLEMFYIVAHLGPEPSVDSYEFGRVWPSASLRSSGIDELDKLTMLV